MGNCSPTLAPVRPADTESVASVFAYIEDMPGRVAAEAERLFVQVDGAVGVALFEVDGAEVVKQDGAVVNGAVT
jgi:hypothetical protein